MALKPEEFARQLVELRGPNSKETAAAKIGVSARQYARWEKGESDPHWGSIEKVALAYGLDPYEFWGEVSEAKDGFGARLERLEGDVGEILRLLRATLPALAASAETEEEIARSARPSGRKRRANGAN